MNKWTIIGAAILIVGCIYGYAIWHDFKDGPYTYVDIDKPKIMMIDGRVVPTTTLTPEQLKVQEEQGCKGCHTK